MALTLCCEFRTGVLFLGFLLGTFEVGLAVLFYTFKEDIRRKVGYEVRFCEDLNLIYIAQGHSEGIRI